MKKMIRLLGLLAVAAVVLVLGCTESPSPTDVPLTPESSESLTSEPSESLFGDLIGTVEDVVETTTVNTIRRTRPVGGPATCATETVGPRGGVLECEAAGLRVTIPRDALAERTDISIHIPDRNLVGYEFAPHGLEFRRDVELRQSVEGTELETRPALLRNLVGAYVEEITPVADALEILPAILRGGWLGATDVRIDIRHFSGYVCATN